MQISNNPGLTGGMIPPGMSFSPSLNPSCGRFANGSINRFSLTFSRSDTVPDDQFVGKDGLGKHFFAIDSGVNQIDSGLD